MDIISRIDAIMKKKGISPYQLAKISELSPSTISNMYQRNTIPSIPTLESICKALDMSLAQFFAEDEDEFVSVDTKQKELLDFYLLLDDEQQDAILTVVKNMKPTK